MDSRAAMTYHLGNALLHLQYLAGHMPWFVPPADIAPAPASVHTAPNPGLTTFVPHPGRHSHSASSSRPITEYTASTRTIDGQPGVLLDPPSLRDPVSSSSGYGPPAVLQSRQQFRFRNHVDHELITYKKDTKARPSWKTIGQRLHRSAESCRARWLWLQSTGRDKINVLAPPRTPEE
eukprot:s107_g42.t1